MCHICDSCNTTVTPNVCSKFSIMSERVKFRKYYLYDIILIRVTFNRKFLFPFYANIPCWIEFETLCNYDKEAKVRFTRRPNNSLQLSLDYICYLIYLSGTVWETRIFCQIFTYQKFITDVNARVCAGNKFVCGSYILPILIKFHAICMLISTSRTWIC